MSSVAGMAGLEPADEGVKVPCLTTWLHPCVEKQTRDRDLLPIPHLLVGWVKGLEPSTPGTTIRCSNQLSYTHHISGITREASPQAALGEMVRQKGFEPPAYCLEGSCSILLSYWRLFSRQLAPAPGFPRTRPQAQLYYHPRSHLSSVPRAFPHVISIFYLTRSS